MSKLSKTVVVSAGKLREFVSTLFEKQGLCRCDAQEVAHMFVLQEMRGITTHGLHRVGPNLEGLVGGWMNPNPKRSVLTDSQATVVIDGDHGVGMLGCMAAMRTAIERARTHGIAIAIVINNNHFLSAAPYCLEAVNQDMIGLSMSNTEASMGYPGSTKRVIGNSPIGFGVPTNAGFPVVFDSSLTTSSGKLKQYVRQGLAVPKEQYGLDSDGKSTNDPLRILEGGTAMPIGGYKGAGLSVLVEVLTGILGQGAFLQHIIPPEQCTSKQNAESQCCIAIDISHFMAPDIFKQRMTEFIDRLKDNPLATDYQEIRLPGERAASSLQSSLEKGIPIQMDVQKDLCKWAQQLGAKTPF